MEQYLIYLRKSRSDLEAEAHGEGETLSRHEHTLLELAKRQHLNVTDIYREVVSGDTIAARPMMQRVLSEVEQGVWSGVLVMEVERLARGDTIDQGIIAQTFKFSGTKIITPTAAARTHPRLPRAGHLRHRYLSVPLSDALRQNRRCKGKHRPLLP